MSCAPLVYSQRATDWFAGLARALLATGGGRDIALDHARAAERSYGKVGGRYDQERARVLTWLAEHE